MTDDMWTGPAIERIDDWERGFARRAAQAKELAERTAQLSSTARDPDGLVEVTVGANGQMTALRLDEEIRRQSAEATARQILATLRAARSDLVRQVGEITAETVGDDSETGRAVMAGFQARIGTDEDEPRS